MPCLLGENLISNEVSLELMAASPHPILLQSLWPNLPTNGVLLVLFSVAVEEATDGSRMSMPCTSLFRVIFAILFFLAFKTVL